MKKLDQLIHWKLLEISIMIAIIVISLPLWKQLEVDEIMTTAAYYDNAQYTYIEVENYPTKTMFPIDNETALNTLKPTIIKVINETKTEESYTLLLIVEKTSTLDYHCLDISLDGKSNPLEKYFLTEDDTNIYFALTSDSIIGNMKTYEFLMWMDYKTGNEMQGKSLNYSFDLQQGMNI